jgi:muramoyltetrapeptide carboxypeptidase
MFFLKKRDRITLIAPGRMNPAISISKCMEFIESWGYEPYIDPDTLGHDSFYAQNDQKRFECLLRAISCSQSRGLWCLRGGYGTTRLLSQLPLAMPVPEEKLLIGLSDCTGLLLYAYAHWPWTIIHGPVLGSLAHGKHTPETVNTLKSLIKGSGPSISYGQMHPLNDAAQEAIKEGALITGPMVGGNLCLMQSSIGTSWMPKTEGHVVFLEDIHESPYRTLERFHHLKLNGLFNSVKALVFFDFIEEAHTENPSLSEKAFHRMGAELGAIPVFKGSGVGHGAQCFPIAFGSVGAIKNGELTALLNKNPHRKK